MVASSCRLVLLKKMSSEKCTTRLIQQYCDALINAQQQYCHFGELIGDRRDEMKPDASAQIVLGFFCCNSAPLAFQSTDES